MAAVAQLRTFDELAMMGYARTTARPIRYGFHALGALLAYLSLVFARARDWSWPVSIVALVIVSIPIGLVLGRLKYRIQARSTKVR
jgi:hypothetical protein